MRYSLVDSSTVLVGNVDAIISIRTGAGEIHVSLGLALQTDLLVRANSMMSGWLLKP